LALENACAQIRKHLTSKDFAVLHLERFRALTRPGFIGNYTHCELTEIIALAPGTKSPQNIFSLGVVEERQDAQKPTRLTKTLLQVPGLKDWKFGIYRTVMPLEAFERALQALEQGDPWAPAGEPLGIGALRQAEPLFVPADSAKSIPLNKILKNNFWGGSHLLEWSDPQKSLFKPFFETPALLDHLVGKIRRIVPIDLALISDRLGNIIIQVPVTVLMVSCSAPRDGSDFQVSVRWRPGAIPRPLRATMSAEYDSSVAGFASAQVERDPVSLPVPAGARDPKVYVLDETSNLLVGATGALGWISQIAVNVHAVTRTGAEPRTFDYEDRQGQLQSIRVTMHQAGFRHPILVGEAPSDPNGGFTQKRLYRYDTEQVQAERLFRQYGVSKESKLDAHQKALADLYFLMGRHGETGVWLWDPYLDAVDLLETLFHCPYGGADLRALGGTDGARRARGSIASFMTRQATILNNVTGNLLALRLSYRIPYRMQGAAFHDRFIIFPQKEGGHLAWSLGTSVNSLGHAHHILQRVDDGQRVSDAFRDLWDRMKAPQLVWEKT
jgi:hypothetical protein